ncbi:MAG: cupin domain-containing protein [Haloarculaceae archaeon]
MSHTRVNYEDVDAVAEAMHFLRDPLDAEQVGVTVLDTDGEWEGKPHDHAEDDHEEVYLLVDGAATVTVEGEAVALESGDAVRIDPEATRQIETDEASTLVLVGAP